MPDTKTFLLIFTINNIGISLFVAAYKRAVDPLFGTSIAIVQYTTYVEWTSTAFAIILPKPSRSLLLSALTTLVLVAPYASYWFAVFSARSGHPTLGPLLTHATVLAPVVYLAVSLATSIDFTLATITLAANALQLRPLILLVARQLSLDAYNVVFFVLGSVTSLVWTLQRLGASSSRGASPSNFSRTAKTLWVMSVPAASLLLPALWSPTLSGSVSATFPYHSPGYPLRILSSKDSVTGVVVVGELELPNAEGADPTITYSIRYLRVSHSLLGGVWLGLFVATLDGMPSRTDLAGMPLGDSIYCTFILQEGARLVNNRLQGDAGERESALVIGLGVGISADALIRHEISTTIIEIDPAVFDAARKYFGLAYPGDDRVFLEDARNWVHQRATALQSDEGKNLNLSTFDIVIHDCFSGGVPEHLFSVEFLNELKSIMKPDGVIVVNFAGWIGSQPTRAVVATLLSVFGECRVFHDVQNAILVDQSYSDFLNMVFFCSPSNRPLTFRAAVDGDYLNSYLRRDILSNLTKREIPISHLRERSKDTEGHFVLTDSNNMLSVWQREEAPERWKLMRKILPDVLWETF